MKPQEIRIMDQRIHHLENRVNKLDKRVNGLSATIAAAAALPQSTIPGKSMFAAGSGFSAGTSAVAVSYSRMSDNGKTVVKFVGTANTSKDYSAGIGVGYHW